MKRTLLALAITMACYSGVAHSATIKIYLLNAQDQSLGHGKAIIFAFLPDENRKEYVPYIWDQGFYQVQLPNTAVVDLEIRLDQSTVKKEVLGLSGRYDHTLHLRADRATAPCMSWGGYGWEAAADVSSDHIALIDDLDRLYPNGTPARFTNIRTFLSNNVVRALDKAAEPPDPKIRAEKQRFRSRVMRHLAPAP